MIIPHTMRAAHFAFMQVVVKMGITLEAGRDHADLAALQTFTETGITLIGGQLVAGCIVVDPLRVVTLGAFE